MILISSTAAYDTSVSPDTSQEERALGGEWICFCSNCFKIFEVHIAGYSSRAETPPPVRAGQEVQNESAPFGALLILIALRSEVHHSFVFLLFLRMNSIFFNAPRPFPFSHQPTSFHTMTSFPSKAIKACGKRGQWEQAFTLLREMAAEGAPPDAKSYEVFIV